MSEHARTHARTHARARVRPLSVHSHRRHSLALHSSEYSMGPKAYSQHPPYPYPPNPHPYPPHPPKPPPLPPPPPVTPPRNPHRRRHQGRRLHPSEYYKGFNVSSSWSSYVTQLVYYTCQSFNSDPGWMNLFVQVPPPSPPYWPAPAVSGYHRRLSHCR